MADSLELKKKKLALKRKREAEAQNNKNNRFLDKDFARSAVGQGLFFGYGDEIEAKIRSMIGKKSYEELLPEIRGALKAYEQDFPVQSVTNEIIGSIPSGILLTIATGGFGTPVVAGTRIATLANKAKPFLQAMGLSGLYGSGKEEGDVVEKIKTGAKTAPFGLVLYPIQKLAGSKPAQAIKDKLNLTIGQKIGGFTKRIEESLKSVPILGESIRNREQDVLQQMNVNIYNKVLKNIGKKIDKNKVGHDAFDEADGLIRDAYKDIIPKLELDEISIQQLVKKINTIGLDDLNVSTEVAEDFIKQTTNLITRSTNASQSKISGQNLKNLESKLSKTIRDGVKNPDAAVRENAFRLQKVRNELTRLLEKNNPKHAKDLRNINLAFRQFLPIQKAVSSSVKNNGVFTTGQLITGIRQTSPQRDLNRGSGGAGLQKEAQQYHNVLKNVVPDSGTAERSLTGIAGVGGAAVLTDPITVGTTLAAGKGLYTKGGQRIADIATDKLSLLGTSGGLANVIKEQTGLLD
jgi:hypothetical protein